MKLLTRSIAGCRNWVRSPGTPRRVALGVGRRAALRMAWVGAATAALVAISMKSSAHEAATARPTPEQLAALEPPLSGSEAFTQKLLSHLRGELDEQGLELFDQLEAQLRQRDHIRWGHLADSDQRESEYYRWQAERRLLELLAEHLPVVELDYRGLSALPDPNPDRPIPLDPRHDVLLLKVVTGDGPTSFHVQPWDLNAEYPNSYFRVDVAEQGTSYVMLELSGVPEEQSSSLLGFRAAGAAEAKFLHAVSLAPRAWGHLALDVRDEHGESTPALVRLATREGNRLWEPAGAVDLRACLNEVVPHLSLLGRGYMFYLPGDNRGRYWIVAKPLEMTLPTGDWELRVVHGPEYKPIQQTLHVEADQWTRREIRLERWTNMPAQGWYSGDDHIHARLLNSEDAENLLNYARAADVHVANILEMGDHLRTYYLQRGFGPNFRVHHGDHWLVPGQEDPRSMLGHAIGLNLPRKVRDLDKYLLNDWAAGEIHRLGGLYGHTHVGANACMAHREMALFTPMGIVDFNSIMQASLGLELYYNLLNLGFKLTASAGADTPYGGTVGAVRVYAHTGTDKPFSPDRWFEALGRGRTFVTNGPMLEFRVGDAMPGDEVKTDGHQPLAVRLRAVGLAGASAPKSLRLVRLGETYREVVSDDPQRDALELEVMLEPGHGCWLAAHAVGHDGSEAHSTPIYVVRQGFRHWNVDQAPALIEKQLAVLDEIERDLTESKRLASLGNSLDYWNRLNAEQSDQVRERLERSRASYRELQATHQRELAARGEP